MDHKRCFTRQCLITNITHEATLTCKCSHVQSEQTSLQEHLATNFTVFLYRQHVVWNMLSFMKCQIMFVWISLATHITLKWPLSCVYILVSLSLCIGIKPFTANTTMEFVVTEMSLSMTHQIWLPYQRWTTNIIHVILLSCMNLWSLKSLGHLNFHPHISQGCFSLWMTMCEVNFLLQLNASPHTKHKKGFSPVCIWQCISSLLFIKTFPQNSHLFVHFSFDEMHFKFPTEPLESLSIDLERTDRWRLPKHLPIKHYTKTTAWSTAASPTLKKALSPQTKANFKLEVSCIYISLSHTHAHAH
jgi:hypothetical protein